MEKDLMEKGMQRKSSLEKKIGECRSQVASRRNTLNVLSQLQTNAARRTQEYNNIYAPRPQLTREELERRLAGQSKQKQERVLFVPDLCNTRRQSAELDAYESYLDNYKGTAKNLLDFNEFCRKRKY